jgi:hypothetical protein
MLLSIRSSMLAAVLAASFLVAQATTVNLAADGQWNAFAVDSFSSQTGGLEWIDGDYSNDAGFGTPLSYTFTIAEGQVGTLSVADAGFAGDTFSVYNNGQLLGATSSVPVTEYGSAANVGLDFDAALQNNAFSKGVFTLGAGTYSVTGVLAQSMLSSGSRVDATVGGIKLVTAPVPEPSSAALLLAALGVTGLVFRRRIGR